MAAPDGVHNINCKAQYMDGKGGHAMTKYNKITALYSRLSVGDEDRDGGESNSIQNQEKICQGGILPKHMASETMYQHPIFIKYNHREQDSWKFRSKTVQ